MRYLNKEERGDTINKTYLWENEKGGNRMEDGLILVEA